MIFFFDRDVGISLPKALIELRFDKQFNEIHFHQQLFPIEDADDNWLPKVGQWGWTVIGHDSQHHVKQAEISAIKQYSIGCFYLWGSEAKRWEKMQCFARAYERIIEIDRVTPKPYIFRINRMGRLQPVSIP